MALYAITSVLQDLKFARTKKMSKTTIFWLFTTIWICQHWYYCIQRHLQTLHFKAELTQKDFEVNHPDWFQSMVVKPTKLSFFKHQIWIWKLSKIPAIIHDSPKANVLYSICIETMYLNFSVYLFKNCTVLYFWAGLSELNHLF